jgi:hypothetical protein
MKLSLKIPLNSRHRFREIELQRTKLNHFCSIQQKRKNIQYEAHQRADLKLLKR